MIAKTTFLNATTVSSPLCKLFSRKKKKAHQDSLETLLLQFYVHCYTFVHSGFFLGSCSTLGPQEDPGDICVDRIDTVSAIGKAGQNEHCIKAGRLLSDGSKTGGP